MNTTLARAATMALAAAALTSSAWLGTAIAHAEPATIDLSEIHAIDTMPLCLMEDGSDVDPASLPCIWGNQGNAWLTYSDHSLLIVDQSDGSVSDMDLGA